MSAVYIVIPISIAALIVLRKLIAGDWKLYSKDICMKGKTVIITGANSGVGLETAKALVKRRATVIFACRNMERARNAIAKIRAQESGGELIPIQLDLASFESIENFVKIVKADFDKIDVLINNAGVVVRLEHDRKTEEGFEMNFGVNHLGHFYLTNLLLNMIKKAAPSRIVVVSSKIHERGTIDFEDINLRGEIERAKDGRAGWGYPGYANSKLMNNYFTRALAEKLKGSGVEVNAYCPGLCYTNVFSTFLRWYDYLYMVPYALIFMRSAAKGADTGVFLATDPSITGHSGGYYCDCKEYTATYPYKKEDEEKLWQISEEMVKTRKPI